MKKRILIVGSLLMMATIANAQVGKEFQGNYSLDMDVNLLISNWSKDSNSKQTITIKTGVSKDEFKSPEEIEKMINETANKMIAEAKAELGIDESCVSSTMTMTSKSGVIYDDIIVKANSIESFDKKTGKKNVMFSFEDKDVEKISNGYKIKSKDGGAITLIRKDKQTLAIPERGYVLKMK